MDLEKALEQFDTIEANLRRLEAVWSEMKELAPYKGEFREDGPAGRRYRELLRSYHALVAALPPIGTYEIESCPPSLDDIAQLRMELQEEGGYEWISGLETGSSGPGPEMEEYRAKLTQARRELVRDRLVCFMGVTDALLRRIVGRVGPEGDGFADPEWEELQETFDQIERLTGGLVPYKGRWSDMRRHLTFGQSVDVHDIVDVDWPSVREEIEANLYSQLEPLPVEVNNIATLIRARPSGPVTTKLNWRGIADEEFERLLFNIVADADDYTNPQWLMHTNAPDRGRDISVERISNDSLGGTKNLRVIIQAKHWLSKSVRLQDASCALDQMALWEPPRVHVLVMATSGTFTADAVAWVEKHNDAGKQPAVEMWASSHLERLLAHRPHLVAEFRLRQT